MTFKVQKSSIWKTVKVENSIFFKYSWGCSQKKIMTNEMYTISILFIYS